MTDLARVGLLWQKNQQGDVNLGIVQATGMSVELMLA